MWKCRWIWLKLFFFSLYTLACIIYNGKSTIAIKDYYVRIVSFPSPRLPADIYSSMYYLIFNIIKKLLNTNFHNFSRSTNFYFGHFPIRGHLQILKFTLPCTRSRAHDKYLCRVKKNTKQSHAKYLPCVFWMTHRKRGGLSCAPRQILDTRQICYFL